MFNHQPYSSSHRFVCLLLLFIAIVTGSCEDKLARNGWDTEVLTPLAHTKVDINDVVADSLLDQKADSSLSLVFRETIFEFDPNDELLKIPDTSLVNNFKLDSLTPMAHNGHQQFHRKKGTETVELFRKDNRLIYDFGGPELTFFEIRSGQLEIFITSTLNETLRFEFNMDEATDKQGQKLFERDTVPPAPPNGNSTIERTFDLSGFQVDLRGPNQNQVNTIQPILAGKVDTSADLGAITRSDSVFISYKLKDIVPQFAKGFLGKDTVDVGREIVDFNAFESVKSGIFQLDEVRADFTIVNGLGVDGRIQVDALKAIKGNQETALQSSVLNKPIAIPRAINNPRISTTTSIQIDEQNSNIKSIIEDRPKRFYYDIQAFINPNGNQFNYQDFGYYDSRFDVNFDVEIPLRIQLKNLVLADTTEFNIGLSNKEIDKIKKGELNLITYNKFPYDLNVQMFLYDDRFVAIDTLFMETFVEAGPLNDSCRVTEPRRTRLKTEIQQQRLRRIQNVETAVITATFANPSTPAFCSQRKLQIFNDYNIDVTLSARFNYFLEDAF